MHLLPLYLIAAVFAAYSIRSAFLYWMYEPRSGDAEPTRDRNEHIERDIL